MMGRGMMGGGMMGDGACSRPVCSGLTARNRVLWHPCWWLYMRGADRDELSFLEEARLAL